MLKKYFMLTLIVLVASSIIIGSLFLLPQASSSSLSNVAVERQAVSTQPRKRRPAVPFTRRIARFAISRI